MELLKLENICFLTILTDYIKKGEWQIENGLHLYLDMVFLEDKNKCLLENSQKNLNIIRKYVLALVKRYKAQTKLSMNIIRLNISMDFKRDSIIIYRISYRMNSF